jgi:pimeloyl-ACP methyl ester carboxylesterase
MIHGMWGTPAVWEAFRRRFEAEGYEAAAPALRHHGAPGSPAPAALGTTSLRDYAADLEAEIGALARPPVLMGHSMGGLLALLLAAKGLARALVLLAPATPTGLPQPRPALIRMFARSLVRRGAGARAHLPRRREADRGLFNLVPPERRAGLAEALVAESGRALMEIGFAAFDRGRAARIDYDRIRCPVLIVVGGQDRIVRPASCRRLLARLGAGADYLELADHAHWLMGEPGWEAVADACEEWIRRRSAEQVAQ